ncbi:MAG TPA: Rrf2 family transcriptional regulator [Rectinemataceae bacterium]|nr:Rrf2 family transcriptional regulator [Rectinemataceae bacterium]
MDRLLNISDRTNAALHALALAVRAEEPITASGAARRLGVSPSYLAKVLQPLAKAGILASSRGAAGGFTLAREARGISALEVLELLDGEIPARDCLFAKSVCPRGSCALKRLCDDMADAARRVLGSTSVADLARSFQDSGARSASGPSRIT